MNIDLLSVCARACAQAPVSQYARMDGDQRDSLLESVLPIPNADPVKWIESRSSGFEAGTFMCSAISLALG